MKTNIIIVASLSCALFACSGMQGTEINKQGTPETPNPDVQMAKSLMGPMWPATVEARSTTQGRIYLSNLNSQIAAIEKQLTRRKDDRMTARLALDYYYRFQILGRLSDAEQARELLKTASLEPHDSSIDLAYAKVLLGFHEFEMAWAALDIAAQNQARPEMVSAMRRAIVNSTGQAATDDETEVLLVAAMAEPSELVTMAAESINRGKSAQASVLLKAAQDSYSDSSPYLLSWIQVQQGILYLRHGEYVAAETFFRAAHERFPEYALATEHLAETQLALGKYDNAVSLYSQVAEQTGNPEFYFQLANAERELNMNSQAAVHLQMAQSGYTELLQRYPTMFADHAARYYLETDDVSAALKLARQNYAQRQDLRASTLLLETELAAGEMQAACKQLERIKSLHYAPPELPSLVSQFNGQCAPLAGKKIS